MESNLPVNKATLKPYIVELKNHFISELNYVELQKNHNQTKMDDLLHETQIPIKEKLSFGCKKSPGYLTPFIQALNVKIDFLDHRTTTEDFIRIATSEDLNLINEKIYLGCKTNEFRYLINYLKPLFKSFNPATIGKSGIFISNTGHQINADSIYNSKIDNLQKKFAIDNIFNKK